MFGSDGMKRRDAIMESLRANPPKTLDGQPVLPGVSDFWDEEKFGKFRSETDKLPRNTIQFSTGNCIVTVRPSGTEPKIKLYCQLLPDGESARHHGLELFRTQRERAERLACSVYGDLLERAGLPRLERAALLLPDIVSFERKAAFQNSTVEQLRAGLEAGRWAGLPDLLAWLREQTAQMTPGADPLPALKAPVACLCRDWSAGRTQTALFSELAKWAKP
jgi:hypothetical protein